ncbi:unnamed protein product [Amoebophrya sp. A120]|nr:unnamed protein product [Amoebophrya sp. A120]|eukprot:GSA120T00011386001.1
MSGVCTTALRSARGSSCGADASWSTACLYAATRHAQAQKLLIGSGASSSSTSLKPVYQKRPLASLALRCRSYPAYHVSSLRPEILLSARSWNRAIQTYRASSRQRLLSIGMTRPRYLNTENVAPGLGADSITPKGHTHRENRNRLVGPAYFTYHGAAFTLFFGFGMWWFLDYLSKNMAKRQRAAIVEQESIGTPKLGGPWTLYNRQGKLVTDADFRGKYQLIYFGFTFCPDICPEEMEKQGMVIEKLDKMFGAELVEPIFISVDPGRDTVAQVDTYCSEFHKRLQGLTGSPEQVKKVTRAFRVYYNEGIRADGEDYLVDHSIIQYLMDRNGKFVDFFGKNMTVGEIVSKISAQILIDQGKFQDKKYATGNGNAEPEGVVAKA